LNIINDQDDPLKNNLKSLDPDLNMKKYYVGKVDQDNVHLNYLYAKKQNDINLSFLQKLRMAITIPMENMSVYKMQYVELVIYELNTFNHDIYLNDADIKKTDSYKINEKLSGSWLITSISYIYIKGDMKQELTLVKRNINVEYDKDKLEYVTQYFYKMK